MSLRIAHFIQRYPPALGGSEAYFARLGKYLALQGDHVTVFTTTARALEAMWSRHAECLNAGCSHVEGVEVRRYPLAWRWRGRRMLLKALSLLPVRSWQRLFVGCNPMSWPMWRAAGQSAERFHVVHATAFPYTWPIVCGQRMARRLRVPFLLTPFLHTGDPDDPHDATRRAYTTLALRSLLQSADVIFAQTPSERSVLVACGVVPERIVMQGLGVDATECAGGNRQRFRTNWNVGADEVVVGHLANLSVEKGSVDLLEAAARLWQRGLSLRFALAGPTMPNFERYWQRFCRSDDRRWGRHFCLPWNRQKCLLHRASVVKLGVLTEEEKRDFFAGIDIFALPSRSDSFGLVLLEAWANGLPNVAYRAGGIADVIRHGEDGFLVRCGDVDGLADTMGQLALDPALRQRMGAAGRARTRTEFAWDDKLDIVRRRYYECFKPASLPLVI